MKHYFESGASFSTQKLTVTQIKKVRALIDEGIVKCNKEVELVEHLRSDKLFQVGNILHESVPISNDEVRSLITVWN